jgi:hypothetical protein
VNLRFRPRIAPNPMPNRRKRPPGCDFPKEAAKSRVIAKKRLPPVPKAKLGPGCPSARQPNGMATEAGQRALFARAIRSESFVPSGGGWKSSRIRFTIMVTVPPPPPCISCGEPSPNIGGR